MEEVRIMVYITKNSTSWNQQGSSRETIGGSPIGLLLSLTKVDVFTTYENLGKNTATYTNLTKN